jgi:hypothetical protein
VARDLSRIGIRGARRKALGGEVDRLAGGERDPLGLQRGEIEADEGQNLFAPLPGWSAHVAPVDAGAAIAANPGPAGVR